MLLDSLGNVIEEVPRCHHPFAIPGLQLLANGSFTQRPFNTTGARAGVHMVLTNGVKEP